MGNSDSKSSGQNSRRPTPTEHDVRKTRRSLSPTHLPSKSESLHVQTKTSPVLPIIQNTSASFHTTATAEDQHKEAKRRIQQRRAKSFRTPRQSGDAGSFRVAVCPITHLSANQKKLIELKWLELDKAEVFNVGRNVCETIFRRDPLFLRVINLQHLASHRRNNSWKSHVNYRAHVQRFCETLNTVIRSLGNPSNSMDRLHEWGASHVYVYEAEDHGHHSKQRLPSAYWEAMTFALNKAAKDLQVESSRGSESPTQQSGYDRRFLLPGDESSQCTTPSLTPSPSPTFSLDPNSTPRRYGRAVCPRAAEAWSVLTNYVVEQTRFGYLNELLLQQMLSRLQAGVKVTTADDETPSELGELSIKTESAANGSLSSTSNGSASSSSTSSAGPALQLEMFAMRRQQQPT